LLIWFVILSFLKEKQRVFGMDASTRCFPRSKNGAWSFGYY